MGTRGAVGVKLDGKYYVTYNHFDSYPSGLGKEVVEFCQKVVKTHGGIELFCQNMKRVNLVKQSVKASKEMQKKYAGYCDESVSSQDSADWYCLLRHLQGSSILHEIFAGKVQHMIDSFSFLKDSLFCEYAYIVNLDDKVLEFYEGFNKEKGKSGPLPIKQIADKRVSKDCDAKYYPVRYVGSVKLEDIEEFNVEQIQNNKELAWTRG
jgi:hypothetical protein